MGAWAGAQGAKGAKGAKEGAAPAGFVGDCSHQWPFQQTSVASPALELLLESAPWLR